MSGFALDGWGLIGALLIALALGLLAGAALGYYTASTDLQAERKAARDAGFQSGIETAWGLIGSDARRVASVVLGKRQLAPEPPHFIVPTPGLFDQDAPTAAARAIELRGDD